MSIIMVIIIAVSLSMDAFSLSLAYGTLNICKKEILTLSIIVGIYHFFMPILGLNIGTLFIKYIPINTDIIVCGVLSFVGVQMIIGIFKNEEISKLISLGEMILFGLAVSLDSFSVGIGLKSIYDIPLVCSIIFSLSSFIFTYLGLILGKKINKLIGKMSIFLGGLTLIIIGVVYLF